jgi:acyl-coenzyme A synthetase/AMP-(fatty) acid ligase
MELKFLGRSDTQIKLNGFRIELGEIESAIMHTGLATRAVAALKDVPVQRHANKCPAKKKQCSKFGKAFSKIRISL